MTQDQIHIKRIKIKDLVPFAENYLRTATSESMIPITLQRAIAHAHNPYADGEDVGLLVAYQGDELVGYFGIMPVLLSNHAVLDKVYWFTTWLVSPKLRGKSVGSLLMKDALSIGQDYLIVGSSSARKVCRRFGFEEFEPLTYYEMDVSGVKRMNPLTWGMRAARKALHPFGGKVVITNRATAWVDRLGGKVTKPLVYQLLKRSFHADLSEIHFEQVDEVRAETPAQKANLPEVLLYRGPQIVNWMLRFPWVTEPGHSPTEHLPFYFSDVRDIFRYIALEVFTGQSKDYSGYVVLSVSKMREHLELKVLDVCLSRQADHRYVLPLALKFAHRYRADTILLPAWVVESVQKRFWAKITLHKKQRTTQCFPKGAHSPLAQAWQAIELNYCDGDMAFS
jgi:GNAT superfamily N-acetyltransferase